MGGRVPRVVWHTVSRTALTVGMRRALDYRGVVAPGTGSAGQHQAATTSRQKEVQELSKQVKRLDRVIIRFAGDSGDGMQLTGDRFTQEAASFGNDLSTLPNFPAEIRAPQGTLPGVSS